MPRPKQCRRVMGMPPSGFFKPQGVPMRVLEQVSLTVDELEAVRLADWEGLYQADAAEKMGVSRQTFGRIIDSAHKKIADALVHGKALRIEGGAFEVGPVPPAPLSPMSGPGPGAGPGWGRGRRGRWGRRHGRGGG